LKENSQLYVTKWDVFDTDDKVRFYIAGPPSMEVLMAVFEHVSSHVYTAKTVAQQISRVHHGTYEMLPVCCFTVNSLQNIFPLDSCHGHFSAKM